MFTRLEHTDAYFSFCDTVRKESRTVPWYGPYPHRPLAATDTYLWIAPTQLAWGQQHREALAWVFSNSHPDWSWTTLGEVAMLLMWLMLPCTTAKAQPPFTALGEMCTDLLSSSRDNQDVEALLEMTTFLYLQHTSFRHQMPVTSNAKALQANRTWSVLQNRSPTKSLLQRKQGGLQSLQLSPPPLPKPIAAARAADFAVPESRFAHTAYPSHSKEPQREQTSAALYSRPTF